MATHCMVCGMDSQRLIVTESRSTQLMNRIRRWWTERRKRISDRQALEYLQALDDAVLKDIGVNRGDVEWAGKLPSSTDALVELQIIARGGARR